MNSLVRKLTGVPAYQKKKGYEYKVLSSSDEYEKRLYPASTWVCTSVTGVYQDTAKIEAFRKLQSYVMGQNEDGAQLKMQAPILTKVSPQEGLSFEREFIVSAFLSADESGNEPLPTNPDVCIEHLPEITVFARSFQGIACEEKWANETRQLLHHLSNKEDIRTDIYFTASYDSPFQIVSTRNEVWILEFNRHTEVVAICEKKREFVQMGSRRLELPSFLSWPLYIIFSYFFVMKGLLTNVASAVYAVKSNRYSVSECWDTAVCYVIQCLSFRSVSNFVKSSVSTACKVTLGLLRS